MNGPQSLQKRGFTFVQRGLKLSKLTKTPLIYSTSYFNLGAGNLFEGLTTPKSLMAKRPSPEQLINEGTLEIAHEICD